MASIPRFAYCARLLNVCCHRERTAMDFPHGRQGSRQARLRSLSALRSTNAKDYTTGLGIPMVAPSFKPLTAGFCALDEVVSVSIERR